MVATLGPNETLFGPYHPFTLHLTVKVGEALRENGDRDRARPLLERAVQDLGRFLDRDYDPRRRGIASLRELLIAEYDY
jgi:hypothetical protein